MAALKAYVGNILNSTLEGSLVRPLRFDNFIASAIDISIEMLDPQNMRFIFSARPDSGVEIYELKAALEKQLTRLTVGDIPTSTFERIKRNFIENKESKRETDRAVLNNALFWIFRDHDPVSKSDYLETLKSITEQDVEQFIKELFGTQGTSMFLELYPS